MEATQEAAVQPQTTHLQALVNRCEAAAARRVARVVEDDDGDDDICPACSGSGEGMYEGTRCLVCRGRGCA